MYSLDAYKLDKSAAKQTIRRKLDGITMKLESSFIFVT